MESEICSKKSTKMQEEEEENNNNVVDNYQKASFLEANIELSKVINGARVSLLHPTAQTPEKNKEEVAVVLLDVDSPLTCESSKQQQQQEDFDLSPRTPKDYVFNSFAPGPDDLMLAPQGKRFTNQSQINVVRRLNFDSSAFDECKNDIFKENDVEVEEILLDKMYKSILDAIVSTQADEGDDNKVKEGGIHVENLSDLTGFTTPTKLPLLNGIAEICPGAPLKSKQSCQKIDLGLCKKLDFFAD